MTDRGAHYAYLFECKGIQRYVFGAGRLRQVIGASDLVANVASSDGEDMLADALEATDTKAKPSRRAGSAFCLHAGDGESLARFRRLWRLAFGVRHPGLEFVDGAPAAGPAPMEAEGRAYGGRTAVRENSAAFLPPTGHPFVRPNPRTGLPAVARPWQDENEFLDAVGAPQYCRSMELACDARRDSVARRFLPEDDAGDGARYRFPRHFEEAEDDDANPVFPFDGNDRRIGFVHADISGLGEMFRGVKEKAPSPEDVFDVAKTIEKAVTAAARAACRDILLGRARNGVVPARPVLLGGDDATVIVRADLAVAFAERFLRAVEDETGAAFSDSPRRDGLPGRLSACAGIAVVSAGHPFQAAARLAEGLCDAAKRKAKANGEAPYPSFLEFAVSTSAIDETFESWREREQTIGNREQGGELLAAAGPRRVGGAPDGESLETLLRLAQALRGAEGRGKLMEAFALRHDSKAAAERPWKRFWDVLEAEAGETAAALRRALDACAPGAAPEKGAPVLDKSVGVLSDALELIDIGAAGIDAGAGGER